MRRLCGEGSCSYLGRSRLAPERATRKRSEKSAEAVVVGNDEGPNEEESETTVGLAEAYAPLPPPPPGKNVAQGPGMTESSPEPATPAR